MSVTLYRIASDTLRWTADDLSGRGAELSGGRWSEEGVATVYASTSRALACLETVVHFNAGELPLNRSLVEIDVPDEIFAAGETVTADGLGIGWDTEPASLASVGFGWRWSDARRSFSFPP